MEWNLKRKLVVGAVAVVAAVGGGVAVAATQNGSPKEESQAIVNDAAGQLGIEPARLTAALKKAFENRVDAAVAAGRLTKEQGDAIKSRIEAGDVPLFGPGLGHHFGHFGHFGPMRDLDAAASYLGLTEAEVRTQLESGKTLAQVAQARGKSVDGLVKALTDAMKKRLDEAVAAGRITRADADRVAGDLEQRIKDRVNGVGPRFFREHHDFGGFGPRFRGPAF